MRYEDGWNLVGKGSMCGWWSGLGMNIFLMRMVGENLGWFGMCEGWVCKC